MLPKFLIADNSQEAPDLVYVVHTEKPQCIINVTWMAFTATRKFTGLTKSLSAQTTLNLSWKKRKNFSKPN